MRPRLPAPAKRSAQRGLTLVELLVGLAIVALLALVSWRGLDGMLRSQAQLRERSGELASLQIALAQWQVDLQQSAPTPYLNALAWDGQVLRIVRRSASEDALVVVAWGRTDAAEAPAGMLKRWQSAPLRDRGALLQAWEAAPQQLHTAGAARLVPLQGWQLWFHEGAQWAPPPLTGAAGRRAPLLEPPVAVRLQLELPAAAGLAGRVQLDWANPSQMRGR